MERGARQPQRRTGGADHTGLGRRGGHGVHQSASPPSIGRPSSKAIFLDVDDGFRATQLKPSGACFRGRAGRARPPGETPWPPGGRA
jgi:hypothetical protein